MCAAAARSTSCHFCQTILEKDVHIFHRFHQLKRIKGTFELLEGILVFVERQLVERQLIDVPDEERHVRETNGLRASLRQLEHVRIGIHAKDAALLAHEFGRYHKTSRATASPDYDSWRTHREFCETPVMAWSMRVMGM
jgi:hypothetical protein